MVSVDSAAGPKEPARNGARNSPHLDALRSDAMTVSAEGAPAWSRLEHSGVTTRERNGVIDTMRGAAILMVIGIHALPRADGSALVIAIDAVLRPCVPVFLFASGFLTARSGHVPLAKRLRRTLEPYTIAFMAAYLFMAANNPSMDHRPAVVVARYGLAFVFVYYYVFVYIGCTIALWLVLRAAGEDEEQRRRRLIVLLAIAIAVGLTVGAYLDPLLQRLGVPASAIEEVRMRDLPFWFAFVAVGAIAGTVRAEKAFCDLRYVLAAVTAAAFAAYAAIRIAGIGDAADYDSIAFFLYAALFCVTMLGFAADWPALAMLGSASYFVYLWHIFVIMALRQVPALQQHVVASALIEFSAALAVSLVLVLAIRRVAGPRLAQWLGV